MDRKTILAADDSEVVLAMERAILESSYDVITAGTGEECIRQARTHLPHLILMDFEMTGIDGLEACRRLRALPAMNTTPILFVTSHNRAEYLEAAFRSGCTDYVIKPIDASELLIKVRTYLGQSDRQ
jgi:CheY-like chemotaxis protein